MKKIVLLISALLVLNSCNFRKENKKQVVSGTKVLSVMQVNPQVYVPKLPGSLSETSGLLFYDNLFWTFNDSGGKNRIYGFNTEGDIEREIKIKNADNHDWEDITQDEHFIYIGDFGNNNGDRKNLVIYRINKKGITKKKEQSISADEIKFSYHDQENFNFRQHSTAFDCEAMVEMKNQLYIFTKNWINETTTVYTLPATEGNYKAAAIDSFDMKCLVTGADISPDQTKIAILGYHNYKPVMRLFWNVEAGSFFSGKSLFIDMDSINRAQTEGICFLGNDTILISCEDTKYFDQQVFYIDLKTIQ